MIESTLAGVAAAVLTEGVKFLYSQASELLNAWRKRRRGDQDDGPRTVVPPDGVFTGDLRLDHPDAEVLAQREEALDDALVLPALVRIANGREADPADAGVVKATETLRVLLEDVIGTRITLVGEAGREPSGTPVLRGEAEADVVEGILGGNVIGSISAGVAQGRAKAKDVRPGGIVAGNYIDEVKRAR